MSRKDDTLARRRPRWLAQLVLAAMLLGGGLLGYKAIMALGPEPKVRKAVQQPLPVRVIAVRAADVRPAWTFYGEVAAVRRSTLQLPVSGRITWVSPNWRDGAVVKQGEELLRIDDLPWRAALAEAEAALTEARSRREEARAKVSSEERLLKDAQAQFEVAQREYERTRRLAARGTVPKARLDQQQRNLIAAREKLEQRRHALAVAKAVLARAAAALTRAEWALKKAQDNLANTVLRAPFDGQLSNPRAELGQQAGPSAQLATLVASAAPEVRFSMPEERLAMLRRAGEQVAGRAVSIVLALRSGEVVLSGRIAREGAEVDRQSGAVALFATLDDPAQARWLKPGMFAEVRMRGPLLKDVVLLPESALHGGDTVYAVADGKLTRLKVRVLGMQGGKVIASGVPRGARVVRHKLAEPKPGRVVKVLKG